MPGAVDTDDQCETAVLGRRHPGTRVIDDDRALRTHTESAGGLDQGRGGDAIDTDTEKVINARGFQALLAARAQRVDDRGDPGVEQFLNQLDRRLQHGNTISVGQHSVEAEDHGVVVARVDGDRRRHGDVLAGADNHWSAVAGRCSPSLRLGESMSSGSAAISKSRSAFSRMQGAVPGVSSMAAPAAMPSRTALSSCQPRLRPTVMPAVMASPAPTPLPEGTVTGE